VIDLDEAVATRSHFWNVAHAATMERLLHPGSGDLKQERRGDLNVPARDLSVRETSSLVERVPGCCDGPR
jgi:hypothetical protein